MIVWLRGRDEQPAAEGRGTTVTLLKREGAEACSYRWTPRKLTYSLGGPFHTRGTLAILGDKLGQAASVLVVEDEPAILRVVTAVIKALGYNALGANDGETATRVIEEKRPDFVITDVRLPGMDGVELTNQIKSREELAGTPVLLMSAFGEPRRHRGDGFLQKPFDIEQLEQAVTEHLSAGRNASTRK